MSFAWTEEKIAELRRLWDLGLSATDIAAQIGAVSRNAILGRIFRMGLSNQRRPASLIPADERKKKRYERQAARRKETRWDANPRLAALALAREEREARLKDANRKETRAMFDRGGMSKTSAAYRKHMTKLPEMTRGELRAMLAEAVANTAEMS